jgi:hypothetical protein
MKKKYVKPEVVEYGSVEELVGGVTAAAIITHVTSTTVG